jgi:hypothetical protein
MVFYMDFISKIRRLFGLYKQPSYLNPEEPEEYTGR